METNTVQDQPTVEQLRGELNKLRRQLHKLEQKESDAGLRVTVLEEQQETTEQTIAVLQEESNDLAHESIQVVINVIIT